MPASFRMDRYVVDVLLRDLVAHDRSPSTFLVYLFLAVNCGSARAGKVSMSLAEIADRTGLSKRAVQTALLRLRRRHLITSTQERRTATPVHAVLRPWRATR
jgi:DNA-binding transcriptional ArsR family regulator